MNSLDLSALTPHGFCLAWQPGLIWLHAASDLLIAAAYFSIPVTLLLVLRRRRDLVFKPVFGLFAAFILACGTTHILGAVTLWLPVYWLDGGIKALTAGLSVVTAAMLWKLVPKVMALPSSELLREANEALARDVATGTATATLLRADEARHRQLYARSPAALHAIDAGGILLEVSDRWLDLLGYERHEVLGLPIQHFYLPDSAEASGDHLAALAAGSLLHTADRRMRCKDGRIRDVELVLDVERDTAGRLQRVLAAVTDVTASRETRAALRVAEERLNHAQRMEVVGQLTGGIAHYFNNLLTSIMGSLELLRQRATLDERAIKLTDNALEGSRRAAKLTSQLLSFSRRQRLSPEPLMPAVIVAGMGDLLARTLGDRIVLETCIDDDVAGRTDEAGELPWPVLADRSQMEQALFNLVINARDAIKEDGRVTIRTGNRRLTADRLGAWRNGVDVPKIGDYVSICVVDTGCGMTEAVRARAFEPFFTTTSPGSGSGLGLSQTYGFVAQSGGAVRIQSTQGKGTTVEMLLPRAAAGLPEPVAVPAPSRVSARGEHVVLVEDDALLRHAMYLALQAHGFRVSPAAEAGYAMRLLRGGGVDLLFADVHLPGVLSGIDLAKAARTHWPDLPILLTTGDIDAPDLADWSARQEVLPKPYTAENLISHLLALLPQATSAGVR